MQKNCGLAAGGPPAAGAPCHGTNGTMVNPALGTGEPSETPNNCIAPLQPFYLPRWVYLKPKSYNNCRVWKQMTAITFFRQRITLRTLIHSDHFYSAFSSSLLLRSAPDITRILCRSFTPKGHRQLRMKDLPKVLTWRIERDSKLRPSG